MDVIKEFNKDEDSFAKEAVVYSQKNKDKVSDILLKEIDDFIESIPKRKNKYCKASFVYSCFLLAEFEDKRLFSRLIKIASITDYDIDKLFWEALTNNLSDLLVSVYDGDIASINKIIENKKIDKFVRSEFLQTYIYFGKNNIIPIDKIEDYLTYVADLYDYKYDYIYNTLIYVINDLHLFNLLPLVKKMFQRKVVDSMFFGDYAEVFDGLFDYEYSMLNVHKVEDTVKEMAYWACFKENDNDEEFDNKMAELFENLIKDSITINNTYNASKIGRNDPCPCGSGKKYKKCCIDKDALFLPYQKYIDESLARYPDKKRNANEKDLYDFYDSDAIEIDKLMYNVFQHKAVPIFIKRDYLKEDEINLDYFNQIYEKLKGFLSKHHYKNINEYDKQNSIHYPLLKYFVNYSELLINKIEDESYFKDDLFIEKLENLIKLFYDNFDLNNANEIVFIDRQTFIYRNDCNFDEAIEYLEDKLNSADKKLKYDIYSYIIDAINSRDGNTKAFKKYIKAENAEMQKKLNELISEYQ